MVVRVSVEETARRTGKHARLEEGREEVDEETRREDVVGEVDRNVEVGLISTCRRIYVRARGAGWMGQYNTHSEAGR